jgi:hypothetical protein
MTWDDKPPKTEASIAALLLTAKRGSASGRTTVVRDALKASLRLWAEDDRLLTQGDFWRIYSYVKCPRISLPALVATQHHCWPNFDPLDVSNLDFENETDFGEWTNHFASHESTLNENRITLTHDENQGFIVDGLQRQRTIYLLDITHEISLKSARQALLDTLAEIEKFSDEHTDFDFFKLVSSTLSEKILASVKLVVRFRGLSMLRPRNDDTRHKVLNFSIHTGNSPPLALSVLRPAIGSALVTLNTNVRRVFHGTIQFRHSSRNLRNAVYRRYSRPRDGRGTRNHAHPDRRTQPSGCRSSWVHRSLAKRA